MRQAKGHTPTYKLETSLCFLKPQQKKLWVQHSKHVKVRFIEPETLSIFAFFLQRTTFPAYTVYVCKYV